MSKTINTLIEELTANLDRAEDDNWTVLCLQTQEGESLLRQLLHLRDTLSSLGAHPDVTGNPELDRLMQNLLAIMGEGA